MEVKDLKSIWEIPKVKNRGLKFSYTFDKIFGNREIRKELEVFLIKTRKDNSLEFTGQLKCFAVILDNQENIFDSSINKLDDSEL